MKNFGTQVSSYQSAELRIETPSEDQNVYRNRYGRLEGITLRGWYDGDRLIQAALKVFCQYCEKNGSRSQTKNGSIRYHSCIPRQVGLAGSSAMITAAFRALR